MAADGNWNLVVSTPMGEGQAALSLSTEGPTLKAAKWPTGNRPSTINGNEASWKVSITDPMLMTLEFNGTVDRNELAGSVILGDFGTSALETRS